MIDHETAHRHQQEFSKNSFGFWLYLMTDCILFASLFATYAVLRSGTAGGPTGAELFDLNYVFIQTVLLLTSSLSSGFALLGLREGKKRFVALMLGLTFLLGAVFLGMELVEFSSLIREGYSWQTSAFLSAFFTLVGTHGLHIFIGLIWITVLLWYLLKKGFTNTFHKRLAAFSMFWHFLDLIWIFIFTLVYLLGIIG